MMISSDDFTMMVMRSIMNLRAPSLVFCITGALGKAKIHKLGERTFMETNNCEEEKIVLVGKENRSVNV
jgi:hypothetical protein